MVPRFGGGNQTSVLRTVAREVVRVRSERRLLGFVALAENVVPAGIELADHAFDDPVAELDGHVALEGVDGERCVGANVDVSSVRPYPVDELLFGVAFILKRLD